MECNKEKALEKQAFLLRSIAPLGRLLVAFSGGVDSGLLLHLAHRQLGDGVLAVTAHSVIHPTRELEGAQRFTAERGIEHLVVSSQEMELPEFVANDRRRCYYCKRHVMERLLEIARDRGIGSVAHGANADDARDFRPGLEAARELGVLSPLQDAGLGKAEIRYLSREAGLPTWARPAMPCLATRIPYGVPITGERLRMIEAAETFLLEKGLQGVRVRHHGSVARIEADPERLESFMNPAFRAEIVRRFRMIGYEHVALDLEGYVTGKMNRALRPQGREDNDSDSGE